MKRSLVGKILGKIKIFVQDFVPIRTALWGFSFFGGNVNRNSKLGAACLLRPYERQTSFPTINLVHIPFERFVWRLHTKTRGLNNRKTAVIMFHLEWIWAAIDIMKNERQKNIECHRYLNITPKIATKHTNKNDAEKSLAKAGRRGIRSRWPFVVSIWVNRHARPLFLRRHGYLCTLGYPSPCLRDSGVQLADLVNQVQSSACSVEWTSCARIYLQASYCAGHQ